MKIQRHEKYILICPLSKIILVAHFTHYSEPCRVHCKTMQLSFFPYQYTESCFLHFYSFAEPHGCTVIYLTDPLECTFELVPTFCSNHMAVNRCERASSRWHVDVRVGPAPLREVAGSREASRPGFDVLSANASFTLFPHGGRAAYREPYLFVTHFNSLEVIEIQARSSLG